MEGSTGLLILKLPDHPKFINPFHVILLLREAEDRQGQRECTTRAQHLREHRSMTAHVCCTHFCPSTSSSDTASYRINLDDVPPISATITVGMAPISATHPVDMVKHYRGVGIWTAEDKGKSGCVNE